MPIPVIDLFAGPGGLSEGFAACHDEQDTPAFRVALSIEKDPAAHRTLELRAFFRQFERRDIPPAYYDHLRNPLRVSRAALYEEYPRQAAAAMREAWNVELGGVSESELDERIREALNGVQTWALIGGPPCQAYSVVGRSRRGGISGSDPRVHLYREYLRILAVHAPPFFVMENVPGLISSRIDGASVFEKMLDDLAAPRAALGTGRGLFRRHVYEIHSFVRPPESLLSNGVHSPHSYVIKSEHHGVPQARHRVILLGIRSDCRSTVIAPLAKSSPPPACSVLDGLPRVRSGLSKSYDSKDAWREAVVCATMQRWYLELQTTEYVDVAVAIERCVRDLSVPRADRGAEFISCDAKPDNASDWFHDPRLEGVCNHSTRGHIVPDLHRYLFAAAYAKVMRRSPTLHDFPRGLLPTHQNVDDALRTGHFSDRFRVQLQHRPATTITSHISKDGHYYIHYDASQSRSLTVREAARLQTFPDNYLFCGNRTQQYQQVGNAVPPLLARELARVVLKAIRG